MALPSRDFGDKLSSGRGVVGVCHRLAMVVHVGRRSSTLGAVRLVHRGAGGARIQMCLAHWHDSLLIVRVCLMHIDIILLVPGPPVWVAIPMP